jgi:hypothetical protein
MQISYASNEICLASAITNTYVVEFRKLDLKNWNNKFIVSIFRYLAILEPRFQVSCLIVGIAHVTTFVDIFA